MRYSLDIESPYGIQHFEAPDKGRCMLPHPDFTLHHFKAHKTKLRDFHTKQIDLIVSKIAKSFHVGKPINKVQIIGHSAVWRNISKAEYARRAQERAQNAADALKVRLSAIGLLPKVNIIVENRSNDCPLPGVDNMTHSTSRKARDNRALNRRVEISLTRVPRRKKKPKRRKSPKSKPGGGGGSQVPTLQDCGKDVKKDVLFAWEMARILSLNMLQRFKSLAAMPRKERIQSWGKGHEKTYFGRYGYAHFKLVWRRIRMTNNALLAWRLQIVCNEESRTGKCSKEFRSNLGKIKPGAYARPRHKTIVLCKPWFQSLDTCRRVRMLIHEAAHLAWVLNVRHQQKYGKAKAKSLAKNPVLARRNADNYAYYAIEDRCFSVGP